VLKIIKKLLPEKETYPPLSTEGQLWNKFIEELCDKELSQLTPFQKNVVIAFQYDAQVNINGHSGFFECYPFIEAEEMITSLSTIGASMYTDNFKKAYQLREWDDHVDTDHTFYHLQPPLGDILMEYVALHAGELELKETSLNTRNC